MAIERSKNIVRRNERRFMLLTLRLFHSQQALSEINGRSVNDLIHFFIHLFRWKLNLQGFMAIQITIEQVFIRYSQATRNTIYEEFQNFSTQDMNLAMHLIAFSSEEIESAWSDLQNQGSIEIFDRLIRSSLI